MNKPLLYTAFHLNLAFSSIENQQRATVIERCYWPLLRLAETGIPIGIEATGYTLSEISRLAPDWITAAKELMQDGRIELIGSGYCQIIAPLSPPGLTKRNLSLGMKEYDRLLGVQPRIALVNEQAYSRGILPIYQEAGFEAIMMDWAEPASHNRRWDKKSADCPQRIVGADQSIMPVIWSDAISFQKFQRFAHDELTASEYLEFITDQITRGVKAVPLYTSDAEVFDFRPGRFHSEADINGASEFERINVLLQSLQNSGEVTLGLPSDALELVDFEQAPLRLETSQASVPVKKQRKYNLTRWAVTGRDDLLLNTHCWRLFEELQEKPEASDDDWRALCELWASDFRTHITEARWTDLVSTIPQTVPAQAITENSLQCDFPDIVKSTKTGRFLAIDINGLHLVLNMRRGLAIQAFGYGESRLSKFGKMDEGTLIGTLSHGFFDDIAYGADFYSGHFVHEPAAAHKVTDLNRCDPVMEWDPDERAIHVSAEMETQAGIIRKDLRFLPFENAIQIDYNFSNLDHSFGTNRMAFVTLNPNQFEAKSLFYAVENGGDCLEFHGLSEDGNLLGMDQGAPVSRLVSASTATGMTAGRLFLGDSRNVVGIDMQRTDCAGVGMIMCAGVKESFFARACVSIGELDETRRPEISELHGVAAPVKYRFKVFLEKTPNLF